MTSAEPGNGALPRDENGGAAKLRVLVFILTYNAEKTVVSVLDRIPRELGDVHDVHVLVIDDGSRDGTWQLARERLANFWCPGEALRNPVNQGYGGNQKVGYLYAMDHGFDVVAMVHGDGQYAPECLPRLLEPFMDRENAPSAVYGSRMMAPGGARKGGMPAYKLLANKFLTAVQNRLLGTHLSEFHSGYRLYRVDALRELPLSLDSNGFDFDTEIIIQVVFSGGRIVELPIPTFYGDEVCHVNGVSYAWKILRSSLKARLIRMGIFHDPKFFFPKAEVAAAVDSLSFPSRAGMVIDLVPPGSVVLNVGQADGHLSAGLREKKGCTVVDCSEDDIAGEGGDIPWRDLDFVLLIGRLEEQDSVERFLEALRTRLNGNTKVRLLASATNVGFFITRFMLFIGQFNYGRRGILALSHKRLFTGASLARTLRYAGFPVEKRRFLAAPYPKALGNTRLAAFLLALNRPLARLLPGLFAYEAIVLARPTPGTRHVLDMAQR